MRKKLINITFAFLLLSCASLQAQENLHIDTLSCPIIGFHFGTMLPSGGLSSATTPSGDKIKLGTMSDLYKSPFLDFGLDFIYKTKSNWLYTFEGDLFFGNDNLKNRSQRMSNLFTHDSTSIIIGTNGSDATVTCYNRGLSLKAGIGKVFPFSAKNPNSGLFGKLSAGWMQNQTVFMINEVNAPQIDDNYAHLYDHQRRGVMLSESFGYLWMSNKHNLVNMYIAFEISQCWTRSSREYIIDDYINLQGPDNNHYFDFIYTLKFCWMFPLTGKPTYDYYYC